MPLVRLGLVASLRLADVTTVAHADNLEEGVDAARQADAGLLVFGGADESTAAALARHRPRLGVTRVVMLVGQAERDTLVALLEAGADAVALRSVAPEDLGALVRRVLAGERSLGPALLSVLVGRQADDPIPGGPALPGAPAALTLPGLEDSSDEGRLEAAGVPLTAKEHQVLARLAHGDSNAEIADALFISGATVKTHLTHIYAKLGVGTRHEAMSRAVALGLLH